jgi:hypothetical protein
VRRIEAGHLDDYLPAPASASNAPGDRTAAVSWTDSSGNFWLFGGYGYDSTGALGQLYDLWRFQPWPIVCRPRAGAAGAPLH